MEEVQGLVLFILVSQILSSICLGIGVRIDEQSFDNLGITRFRFIPGILKSVKLFREADSPKKQVVYLLSLIFAVFSYVAVGLLVLFFIAQVLEA